MTEANLKTEMVYHALKKDLLDGAYMPDFHLDKEALCRRYGFSTTPISIALIRLLNDGLVEKRGRDGFYTRKHLPITELREIYLSTGAILKLAAQEFYDNYPNLPIKLAITPDLDIVAKTELFFEAIAGLLGHFTFHSVMKVNNDRLHFIRVKKAALVPRRDVELADLISAFESRDLSRWGLAVDAYIDHRLEMLIQLTRLTDQISGLL